MCKLLMVLHRWCCLLFVLPVCGYTSGGLIAMQQQIRTMTQAVTLARGVVFQTILYVQNQDMDLVSLERLSI